MIGLSTRTAAVVTAVAAVPPDGSVATGPDDSALRAGGASATVVVARPDGRTRAIFFRHGIAVGADISEADPGGFRAPRERDRNIVRVGHERYEIPDAVVLGG